MKRREFVGILGTAIARPLTAQAQATMPVIGFINGQAPNAFAPFIVSFRQGLNEIGYTDGRNVEVRYAWAEGVDDKIPALIEAVLRCNVAVLVIGGTGQTPRYAKSTLSTVPVVVTIGSDPIKTGLVESLNHPAGHITAVSVFTTTIEAKRLDLLRQLISNAQLVGVLVDPTFSGTAAHWHRKRKAQVVARTNRDVAPRYVFRADSRWERR